MRVITSNLLQFEAMSWRGGIPGVHVTLCEEVTVPSPFQGKIDDVSSLSNIAYEDGGMRDWKAYGIGSGKILADKPRCSSEQLPHLTTTNCTTQDLFQAISWKNVKTAATKTSSKDAGDQDKDHPIKLFSCSEEGCVKSYQRHVDLLHHLDCGEHKRELEKETFPDKIVLGYAERLEGQFVYKPTTESGSGTSDGTSRRTKPLLSMGWALKTGQDTRSRFTEKQKNYLIQKFEIGEYSGMKLQLRSPHRC